MPEPDSGESQSEYISRYAGSEEAKKSFPDLKQRLAVAYSKWSKHKGVHKTVNNVKKVVGK